MQGCFMQFLRLIIVKKLQGPHFSADFSILNSHACSRHEKEGINKKKAQDKIK